MRQSYINTMHTKAYRTTCTRNRAPLDCVDQSDGMPPFLAIWSLTYYYVDSWSTHTIESLFIRKIHVTFTEM